MYAHLSVLYSHSRSCQYVYMRTPLMQRHQSLSWQHLRRVRVDFSCAATSWRESCVQVLLGLLAPCCWVLHELVVVLHASTCSAPSLSPPGGAPPTLSTHSCLRLSTDETGKVSRSIKLSDRSSHVSLLSCETAPGRAARPVLLRLRLCKPCRRKRISGNSGPRLLSARSCTAREDGRHLCHVQSASCNRAGHHGLCVYGEGNW